ncbi:impA domain protein (plasmid) [Azospirillum sp. B510]|uniref:type VI secretion system protein TssA n=1 Tax=Azospirillum sp. (strain B510) TaxID=137722 RepID=UPI0001C4BC69|nr:type VI secretion system protein TssA [Azospirillum sp. B510]BAI74031.1 impA domain protein [Azospirillum sp. B510]
MSDRASLGARPVSGPALPSARYEPEFDRLQSEVAKLDSGGPNAVDWREVVRHALTITETKSKDLLVGSYLAYGLLRTESYAGLADGLMILAGMVEAFWDDLHPPKKREAARVNAVNWLGERLGPVVAEHPATPGNAAAVLASADALGRLNEALLSRLENSRPELGEAIRRLGARATEASALLAPPAVDLAPPAPSPPTSSTSGQTASVQPASSEAPPVPPASPPPLPAPAPVPAAVSAGATPAQIDRAIDQTAAGLRTLANAVRRADPSDPRAVELMRAAVWLPVNGLPPAPAGTTPLRSPSAERIERCREWLGAGRFVDLFHDIEESLDTFPYWFEGQRLAALALEGAGGKFTPSAHALRGALATLLRRLPGLGDLRYADGSPFLDDVTRGWVASDILAAPGGTAGGGVVDHPWAKALREARDAVAQGRAKEGVALFSASRPVERAGRGAFLGDLALARLCLEAGFTRAALDIAGKLEALAERRGLEDWEPVLCADLCALVLECYRALPATAEGGRTRADRIAAVQARLGWLAMDRALDFIDVT